MWTSLRREIAGIATRVLPDFAKLLASNVGGPVVGEAAERLTADALERIGKALERLFPADPGTPSLTPEETNAQAKATIARAEKAIAGDPQQADAAVAALRTEIDAAAKELREAYVTEFMRSEMQREVERRLTITQTEIESGVDRARAHNLAQGRDRFILSYAPPVLSLIILTGFFGCLLWMVAKGEIASQTKELVYVMLGALTTSVSAVVTYWFGSSAEASRRSVNQEEQLSLRQMQEATRTASERGRG
jgi:hypothetical protein